MEKDDWDQFGRNLLLPESSIEEDVEARTKECFRDVSQGVVSISLQSNSWNLDPGLQVTNNTTDSRI